MTSEGIVRVGLSGWTYSEWRGDFYPPDLPAGRRLAYASSRVAALEVNASFYRTLRASTYARWLTEAEPGTAFAVKGPKYVTHIRRLCDQTGAPTGEDLDGSIARFLDSGVLGLGAALGPILWQLPPSLTFEEGVIAGFLDRLPTSRRGVALRHALEPRHASWADPRAAAVLREHDVALVTSDLAGRYPMFEHVTSRLAYIRLHGHERLYYSGYSAEQLDHWARRCRDLAKHGHDVWIFFDNSAAGRAPHDAVRLRRLLTEP